MKTTSTSPMATTGRLTDEQCTIVAIAWPTGRPIYAYTVDEIAEGVDVYTKALKARGTNPHGGGDA